MNFHLSDFGRKLGSQTGIQELMDDLGRAMSGLDQKHMLGGGNPAAIPAVQEIWRAGLQDMMARDPGKLDRMLVNYDIPRGQPAFMQALSELLNKQYGWNLTPEHIAITNGSQNAFFYLHNMLAGPDRQSGTVRKMLFPLSPEYIGYADQGLHPDMFVSVPPRIEMLDDHTFKYRVDFDALEIGDDIGGICVSRPTNPSGNVLTDNEVARLSELAKAHHIPLIIDNAYGAPFPGIIFEEVQPIWEDHIVLSLSLSKLGLPGARTGIVIAHPDLIRTLAGINAVISLANNNIGQTLVTPLLSDGRILDLSRETILPFYRERRDAARGWVNEFFDPQLPWALHRCEGAMFLWLWCRDLPITSKELYLRLKDRGVVVVSGHYFFYGLEDAHWPHAQQCLRINYSQPPETVREGLRLIGEELARVYA